MRTNWTSRASGSSLLQAGLESGAREQPELREPPGRLSHRTHAVGRRLSPGLRRRAGLGPAPSLRGARRTRDASTMCRRCSITGARSPAPPRDDGEQGLRERGAGALGARTRAPCRERSCHHACRVRGVPAGRPDRWDVATDFPCRRASAVNASGRRGGPVASACGSGVVEILPVAAGSEAALELDDAPLRLGRGGAQAINAVVATARGDLIVFVAASAAPADAAWLAQTRSSRVASGYRLRRQRDVRRDAPDGARRLHPRPRHRRSDGLCPRAPGLRRDGGPKSGRPEPVRGVLSGLAVRRVTWDAAQGLDVVHLGGAYHDIDLCLRLAERGLRHVWHPGVVFVDERPLRVRRASPTGCCSESKTPRTCVYVIARRSRWIPPTIQTFRGRRDCSRFRAEGDRRRPYRAA